MTPAEDNIFNVIGIFSKRDNDFSLWSMRMKSVLIAKNVWQGKKPQEEMGPSAAPGQELSLSQQQALKYIDIMIIINALGVKPLPAAMGSNGGRSDSRTSGQDYRNATHLQLNTPLHTAQRAMELVRYLIPLFWISYEAC